MATAKLPARVTLPLTDVLDLLVEANVTDPSRWPRAARQGAHWLRRIREIEAQCIAAHGEFDWGKLDRATQDEYDGSRAELNELLDYGKPRISWEELKAKLDEQDRRQQPRRKAG